MSNRRHTGEELIEDLAKALDIPAERYASADRSYKSVCAWLERPGSRFEHVHIDAYTQGSFRLGTAIRPLSGEEDYDLDIVCEFSVAKTSRTQKQLHDHLGHELRLYAERHGMKPPEGWRRCWTLNYADTAQFHMDVLPAVPDAQRQRLLREARSLSLAFVEKSVGITDSEHDNYRVRSDDWPVSNPNGYAEWFYERMRPVFETRRRAMMLAEAKADVAQIPAFRVKTPLQSAIQILKRHRDVRFSEDSGGRPTSIVVSTLAAHAYQQETTISGALLSILTRMDQFVIRRGDDYWIANPSDPRENFADMWRDEPERKDAFYDWLETARTDFRQAAEQDSVDGFIERLAPRMGRRLVEAAASSRRPPAPRTALAGFVGRTMQRILDAPHRKPVTWPTLTRGNARIASATYQRRGFRPSAFSNDDAALPKGADLRFVAQTDVPRPYRVFWQIVNTGTEATRARGLRGGFEEATVSSGTLTRQEGTSYSGNHSIECFIVKDGYCVARSGPFIVNIA